MTPRRVRAHQRKDGTRVRAHDRRASRSGERRSVDADAAATAAANSAHQAELLFGAEDMERYLTALDDAIGEAPPGEPHHLYIAGGAVLLAKTDDRRTHDIDVISEGITAELRTDVERVSQQYPGLRHDWLNDAAKIKRVNLPLEPQRIYSGKHLIVDSAGSRYVLAMKLSSGRPIDRVDCAVLIRELGIVDDTELLDLIEEAQPPHLRTPRMTYFASECLAKAWAEHPKERRRAARTRKRSDRKARRRSEAR